MLQSMADIEKANENSKSLAEVELQAKVLR